MTCPIVSADTALKPRQADCYGPVLRCPSSSKRGSTLRPTRVLEGETAPDLPHADADSAAWTDLIYSS